MSTKAVRLPSGSWRVRVQVDSCDGKRHYKSFTAPTRKEVELMAAKYALKQTESAVSAHTTVGKALDSFLEARSAVLSPSTLRTYRGIRKMHFASLEYVRLDKLTNPMLQRLVNEVAKDHSPKTVRNVYALLTAALAYSYPDFTPCVDLPARVRHEITVPEQVEVDRLLSACKGTVTESAILLAAGYGLRRGEICALRFSDLTDSTLTVSRSLARGEGVWLFKAPKSYAGTRTIQVAPELYQRLWANREDDTRVCPLNPDALTNRFKRLEKRTGISCRFHDLRHYNASIMLKLGVPDKYAMQRLGQSTPGVLKNVYQHLMQDKTNEVSESMNEAFLRMAK